jgi:hypothetical protein
MALYRPWAAVAALSRSMKPISVESMDLRSSAGFGHRNAWFTLVERGGSARSFHVEDATQDTIQRIICENIDRSKLGVNDASRAAKIVELRMQRATRLMYRKPRVLAAWTGAAGGR